MRIDDLPYRTLGEHELFEIVVESLTNGNRVFLEPTDTTWPLRHCEVTDFRLPNEILAKELPGPWMTFPPPWLQGIFVLIRENGSSWTAERLKLERTQE